MPPIHTSPGTPIGNRLAAARRAGKRCVLAMGRPIGTTSALKPATGFMSAALASAMPAVSGLVITENVVAWMVASVGP